MNSTSEKTVPALPVLLWRAVRRRCPACGRAPIFRGWFRMHETCTQCGRLFNRDPGYMLGSIYFNYGVTAMIVLAAYMFFFFSELLTPKQALWVLTAFSVIFPLWFFRFARALWMAFDELFDPWPNQEEARTLKPESPATQAVPEKTAPSGTA